MIFAALNAIYCKATTMVELKKNFHGLIDHVSVGLKLYEKKIVEQFILKLKFNEWKNKICCYWESWGDSEFRLEFCGIFFWYDTFSTALLSKFKILSLNLPLCHPCTKQNQDVTWKYMAIGKIVALSQNTCPFFPLL